MTRRLVREVFVRVAFGVAGFNEFLDDVDRLLHNYLAAAMTLKDHSVKAARRLLPDHPGDNLADDHRERVSATFEAPVARFVQSLRNLTLHSRLPASKGWMHLGPGESFEGGVVLDRAYLLKVYDGWTAGAKRYLDETGERVRLLDVVRDYTDRVDEFHDWLRAAIIKRHRPELRELEKRHADLLAEWAKLTGDPVGEATAPPLTD